MEKTKVSIYGATGYVGVELYRRLKNREDIEIAYLVSNTYEGKAYRDVFGAYSMAGEEILVGDSHPDIITGSDIIFTALPHGHAMEIGKKVKEAGKKLIDMGADFRLSDKATYEKWYGVEHTAEGLLSEAAYVIPELHREKIGKDTWLIANPGCYTTCSQLGLGPLIEAGLIETKGIVIDAKSGVSGAGRGTKLLTHYGEQNENVVAYGIGSHRHTPEIEEHLGGLIGEDVHILFAPHLMPMTRGIHATMYVDLKEGVEEGMLRETLEKKYADEPFVTVLPEGKYPHTKWVYGTNHCMLNVLVDGRSGKGVICSVIDNLGKGAAGQGVQNMNRLLGKDETYGLDGLPVFP